METNLSEILAAIKAGQESMSSTISTLVSRVDSLVSKVASMESSLANKVASLESSISTLGSIMASKTDVAKVSNVVVAGADASSQDGRAEIEEHDNIELASVVVQEFEPTRIQLLPAPESDRGDISVHNVNKNCIDNFSAAASTSRKEPETQNRLAVVEAEISSHRIEKIATLLEHEWLIQKRDKTGNAFDATALLFRARKSFRGARNVEFNRGLFRPFDVWCSKKKIINKSSNYHT